MGKTRLICGLAAIIVRMISNVFSSHVVFGVFGLPARKNTVLQPTYHQELRDPQPSKLSQKIGFMALGGEA